MKGKIILTVILLLFATAGWTEDQLLEPTQNPSAPYRLFNTQNIYTLLKLDTRTGQIWQVQWGDKEHRFVEPINAKAFVSNGKPGRFTLYPTSNVYAFILLDQEVGDAWYVQWGKPVDRFVVQIE